MRRRGQIKTQSKIFIFKCQRHASKFKKKTINQNKPWYRLTKKSEKPEKETKISCTVAWEKKS